MRRIYDSSALRRDDTDPFSPTEQSGTDKPRSSRWVPSSWLSRNLIPHWLRHRMVRVALEVPDERVPYRSSMPFSFVVYNAAPFPVTLSTRSLMFWEWEVDGLVEASRVDPDVPPDERGAFTLDRGQRMRIDRRWNGMFQTAESEWEWAEPGEYTLRARVNVDGAREKGLEDEATVRITRS